MAMAKAICRCATCGEEFEYRARKMNSRDARDFEKWAAEHFDECPECRQKRIEREREEAALEAAEAAKANGWPELTGSEKQVSWANRIRDERISELIKKNAKEKGKNHDRISAAIQILLQNTRASWWIDNRDESDIMSALTSAYESVKASASSAEVPEVHSDESIIAKPQNQDHEGVVDIVVSQKRVSAEYRKDDDFRKVVKSLGYRWEDGAWRMSIDFSTGSAAERAAELGNKLLNAGFSIRIQDPDTLKRAIAGEYEPMTYRWVSKSPKTGKFVISWGKEDDLYSKAKKLPGARYVSPSIQVPAKEYESVIDFAEVYDFKFSPGAQALLKEMQGATVTVTPAASKDAEYDERPLQDVLNSSREIIDDLKD